MKKKKEKVKYEAALRLQQRRIDAIWNAQKQLVRSNPAAASRLDTLAVSSVQI